MNSSNGLQFWLKYCHLYFYCVYISSLHRYFTPCVLKFEHRTPFSIQKFLSEEYLNDFTVKKNKNKNKSNLRSWWVYCLLCLSSLLLSHVPLCRTTSNITLNCFTQLCFFRSVLQWSTDTVTIWPYLKLHFAPSDCGKFISFANLLGTVNVNTFKLCIILFTL